MLLWKSRETKHVGEKPRKQNILGVKSWETKHVWGETPETKHVGF
jgi:hypothetical protein